MSLVDATQHGHGSNATTAYETVQIVGSHKNRTVPGSIVPNVLQGLQKVPVTR